MDDDSHVSAESDNRDRLSELPDSLILQIHSSLPMTDVVTTTILAKHWKDLWTTVPCLHFWSRTDDLVKFRSFVCGALAHWKGPKLLKFSMDFLFHRSISSYLDSWLLFAIEKQVEELYIHLSDSKFHIGFPERDYYLPQFLYSCSSVRKLSIIRCILTINCESVQWNELKSLTIEGFYSLGEGSMELLLCGAPQLEILNLRSSEQWEVDSYIRSSSLKMLKVEKYSTAASSDLVMQSNFWDSSIGNFEFMQTVLRIWAPNLETLELSDWCIKALLQKKEDMLVFPNAKYLKFKATEANDILGVVDHETFPKLMMLAVELSDYKSHLFSHYLEVFLQLGEEPTLMTIGSEPKTILHSTSSMIHLKTVEIGWHALDASIIPCLEFLLGNSPSLEKMVVRLTWHGTNREMLYLAEEKVMSSPRSSPTAEVIIIKD